MKYEDITPRYDMYAVQGPKSRDMLNMITDSPVDEMRFFSFEERKIDGIPALINRAGFSGEKFGYEIYIAPEYDGMLESKLKTAATAFGGQEVTDFQIMHGHCPQKKAFTI